MSAVRDIVDPSVRLRTMAGYSHSSTCTVDRRLSRAFRGIRAAPLGHVYMHTAASYGTHPAQLLSSTSTVGPDRGPPRPSCQYRPIQAVRRGSSV